MKKLFPFLIWLCFATAITLATYVIVFSWRPSIPCASFMAGGVTFMAMCFLMRYLRNNAADLPFILGSTICFLITIIGTLNQISLFRILFSFLVFWILIVCLIFLMTSMNSAVHPSIDCSVSKAKGNLLKVLALVQASFIAGIIHLINTSLS